MPDTDLTLTIGPYTLDLRNMTLLDLRRFNEMQAAGDSQATMNAFTDMIVNMVRRQQPDSTVDEILDAITLAYLEAFADAVGNPTTAPAPAPTI